MNEFFNTLQKEARQIRLSKDEKQAMRVRVYSMLEQSPLAVTTPAQDAALEDFKNRSMAPGMYYWFNPRFAVPLAVVLLVGISGGTAFAAQDALPGEPLYAVKIHVNEKVATALATTPQAKAEVNASIATTRLEEAETLASTGKLDAAAAATLASNFAVHAEAAQVNVVAVAEKDPGSAAQLGTTFSSTLSAHSAILSQLATDSASTSVQESSDALAVQVLAQAVRGRHDDESQAAVLPANATAMVMSDTARSSGGVTVAVGDVNGDGVEDLQTEGQGDASAGAATDMRITATLAPQTMSLTVESTSSAAVSDSAQTPSPNNGNAAAGEARATPASDTINNKNTGSVGKKAAPPVAESKNDMLVAVALEAQANTTLAKAAASFKAMSSKLDETTTLQIQAQLTAAQDLLEEGKVLLNSGDTTLAKEAFGRVLRMNVRLDAFLKAGKKFNVQLLSSLLK